MWLLYFNKNIDSKVYNNILTQTFNKLGFKDNTQFLDEDYSIVFEKWKVQFKIFDKSKYIDWLKDIIDKRVDAIVSNSHRKSYFKAAILVVALNEVLESNDIQNINYYYKKYSRHSAFRRELNKYM